MKKLNKMFFLFATMLVAMGFGGCSDDDGPTIEIVPPAIAPDAKVDLPTSVDFNLTLSGVEAIAYEVEEGSAPAPSTRSKEEDQRGALIFKNAQLEGGSGIITAVEGENKITVKGLEGNKDYKITFAFKTGEEKYTIEEQYFSTPGYNKILTVLETSIDGFKIHVEVPEDKWFRYGYSEASDYYSMNQFGTDDITRMEYNGGLWAKGPQTFEIKNGELWYETEDYDGEIIENYHTILPGFSYVFLIAECAEDGSLSYSIDEEAGGGGGWGPLRSELPYVHDNYTETWENDYIIFDGIYAKVQLDVDAPALVESQLTIEKVKQTERRALYNIIPSNETKQVAVTIFDIDTYKMLEDWVGPNATKWVGLNYVAGMAPGTEPVPVEITDLDQMPEWKLMIYGAYSDDSMIMSYEEIDVKYVPTTGASAELEVTPLSIDRIKELKYDPAYMVGYNVKKKGDAAVAGVKYIANYASEWDELLSYGMTDADILAYYGVDVFEADDSEFIQSINSAEGFDIVFDTPEKTEMVMAIAAFNENEKMSEEVYVSRTTSAEEWGENPIDSPLFTDLAGDWTATYTYERHFVDENWEAQKETLTKTFKVTIADGIDEGPAEIDADTYAMLVNYYMEENGDSEEVAKKKVEDNFADFKTKAKHYSEKYRSLNRMIMTGFEPLHAYKSAWDLAIDLNHSAVDNDDLIYDFGPKMFVQITEEGATLNSDLSKFPPVSGWYKDGYYTREYYLLGCNGEDYLGTVAFPMELSDDKQTLTIKAMDGYYPSVGYTQYGWSYGASFAALGLSEIVMTKGWDGAAEPATRVAKVDKNQKFNARRGTHRFVKTKLPKSKETVTFLNKKITIDASAISKKVEKDMAKRQQMIDALKK